MAVEAVVSVVIHTLRNLLTEESKSFERVRDEAQKVLEELSRFNGEGLGQKELSNNDLQFLGNVYRVRDAIESFALAETYLRRKGYVKKHSLLIGNEFKLCRDVADEMRYSENISRLKSEMNRIRKEIQKWKDGNHGNASVQEQQQGSHLTRLRGQPWQESDAYYTPKNEKSIFKKDVDKLQNQLTSSNKPLQIFSVFGDVGVGKADHVKEIYSKLVDKFQCSTLVFIDPTWSASQLMKVILRNVTGLKAKEKLLDDVLRERLYGSLEGRQYLIVIIDINRRELLDDLRSALPDACNGSRVMITTSNKEAASFADESNRYHFKHLDME